MALQPPQHPQPEQDAQDPQVRQEPEALKAPKSHCEPLTHQAHQSAVTPQVEQAEQPFKVTREDKPGIEPKPFQTPKANKTSRDHIANKPPQTAKTFKHYQTPQSPPAIFSKSFAGAQLGYTEYSMSFGMEGDYAGAVDLTTCYYDVVITTDAAPQGFTVSAVYDTAIFTILDGITPISISVTVRAGNVGWLDSATRTQGW